jgi:hypothetical protein
MCLSQDVNNVFIHLVRLIVYLFVPLKQYGLPPHCLTQQRIWRIMWLRSVTVLIKAMLGRAAAKKSAAMIVAVLETTSPNP